MLDEHDKIKRKEVEDWAKGYCGDCERALGGVRERGRGLI
jgi:hypothetical protein